MDIKNIFTKIKLKFPKKKDEEIIRIQNKKNKYIFILRMLSILVIALLATVATTTILFVYNTVISAIEQVQSISLYQSELRVELIDFNRLDKIEKKWTEKINDEKPNIKRNPFIKESFTTTTAQN